MHAALESLQHPSHKNMPATRASLSLHLPQNKTTTSRMNQAKCSGICLMEGGMSTQENAKQG